MNLAIDQGKLPNETVQDNRELQEPDSTRIGTRILGSKLQSLLILPLIQGEAIGNTINFKQSKNLDSSLTNSGDLTNSERILITINILGVYGLSQLDQTPG